MKLPSQSDGSVSMSRILGSVVQLMLRIPEYRFYPLASLVAWVLPPILLGQIEVFYDERGEPAGYLTWGYLAPDVEARWVADSSFIPHLSEWCEGGQLWLMDLVAPSGYLSEMIAYAKSSLFREFGIAKSLRRNGDGSIKKVVVWRR